MVMKKQFYSFLLYSVFSLYYLLHIQKQVQALPLYTSSRWIVDDEGNRVKLACVNWPSHLETMVADGLSKQPVDVISKKIASMGFNCVRFTWSSFFATDDLSGRISVEQSFQSLRLSESIAGIKLNNPSLLDLPVIKAFQAVVKNLGDNNLMVILDNHINKPVWCCSIFDGNGFIGKKYFDPNLWIKGLTRMATLFNGTSNVVAMSLRNKLSGSKQNVIDWYRCMQRGAEAVHSANPNVLVMLSGLNYDEGFGFLDNQLVNLKFTRKLVFEVHWYASSDGKAWVSGNPNQVCASIVDSVRRRGVSLVEKGWPVFLSGWGMDQRGVNVNDNKYLNCILGFVAELDLDWALEGILGMDSKLRNTRNSSFIQKISHLQSPLQGPGVSYRPHQIIFHPATGLCILRKSLGKPLQLGSCTECDKWTYTPEKTLVIKGTYFCLQADGVGKPAKLGIICTGADSKWEMISDSKMHLSSKLSDGTPVCLDVDSGNKVVTNVCVCLDVDGTCDPASQWFKLLNTTRR